MTVRLYKRDPYMFEFEATVEAAEGEWLILDVSAFYPGGGGQDQDTGWVNGMEMTEMRTRGDEVMHRVPGHKVREGDRVWCSVDWDRRYDLMRAHTAEHMFFSALKRASPETELVKISLTPGQKQLTVRGEIDWPTMSVVQKEVNAQIEENLGVIMTVMERDDPEMEEVRVKLDRIEGDEISVVEIGDDKVACTGTHVMEAGEVGALLVTRVVSAGKGETAIEFLVGEDATRMSMDLSLKALEASEALGSRPDDLVKAARNCKDRTEALRRAVRLQFRESVEAMVPDESGGVPVRSGIFHSVERGDMTDAAERIRSSGAVAVLISVDDSVSVVMGSPPGSRIDCRTILSESLGPLGGRGGGRSEFAQGGSPDPDSAGVLMERILKAVRDPTGGS